ncbi:Uu.00g145670.m01.CDS01 [Anthostomella pinea]|uniref:Uu.00g145670.m01.CDS01 n=1 Tax=Anthostomella pinea TaxID=933095 RepID=A0AAI8YJH1_9PEZI|nr:Uu.00g145670.m01.CDS01 [Anthostomella pinea]
MAMFDGKVNGNSDDKSDDDDKVNKWKAYFVQYEAFNLYTRQNYYADYAGKWSKKRTAILKVLKNYGACDEGTSDWVRGRFESAGPSADEGDIARAEAPGLWADFEKKMDAAVAKADENHHRKTFVDLIKASGEYYSDSDIDIDKDVY